MIALAGLIALVLLLLGFTGGTVLSFVRLAELQRMIYDEVLDMAASFGVVANDALDRAYPIDDGAAVVVEDRVLRPASFTVGPDRWVS